MASAEKTWTVAAFFKRLRIKIPNLFSFMQDGTEKHLETEYSASLKNI